MDENAKKPENRKKRSIISQISTPMVVFLVSVIIVNAIVLFIYNINRYITVRYERADSIARLLVEEMNHYESLDFLIPYWNDNFASMELVYEDPVRLSELERQLDAKMGGIVTDIEYVTSEDAMTLDDEGKKLLAEICYAHMIRFFDLTKQTYKPLFLYSFSMEGDTVIFNVTGALEDEKRISQGGDLFELGVEDIYVEGRYPVLDKVLQTGKAPDKMELSLKSGADSNVVHVFRPVYSKNGEILDIVAVSMEWKSLIFGALWLSGLVGVVSAVLYMLVGVWIYFLVKRVVAVPLMEENTIISEYERNKNSQAALTALESINSGNEIEELADSFSSMVTELDRYVEEIKTVTAEKERIGAELNVATRIQADMLPREFPPFPDRKEFDIYATMDPAKEVGGDFYDFFFIDDDHLALIIADVAGKGVPAALFMVISKTLLKNSALQGGKLPSQIFSEVNAQLLEGNDSELFVTVWMAILTVSTGKMICSNAGHEYPTVRRKGGDYELFKDKHAAPLATMPGMKFRDYEMELYPGDMLFVYTDGVPEATDENEELFGTERMLEALNSGRISDDPKEPNDTVTEAMDKFVGEAPQFDDITMLSFIYRGV